MLGGLWNAALPLQSLQLLLLENVDIAAVGRRSACGDLNVLHSAKPPSVLSSAVANSGRHSRSKMRTPMASRQKAFSADRTPRAQKLMRSGSPTTPPMAFLRYPKPGEVALSKFGSPMVSQV